MDSAMLTDLRGQLQQALGLVDQLIASLRCSDCGRTAATMLPWREDGQVVAWLGPGCHRDRVAAAERGSGVQLPITDEGSGPS